MSRRASLPGADELFRPTGSTRRAEREDKSPSRREEKSTNLQVAEPAPTGRKAPRHETKVTFYCTNADLTALDGARLALRAQHGVGADRGKVVRAALKYVLEDFEARAEDSILLRRLQEEGA